MLEILEIVDGAILVTVYLALSLFLPFALFGVAAAVVATVLRIPLSAIPGLRGERGVRPNPFVAAIRFVFNGAIPLLVGVAAVLAGLDRLTAGASTDPTVVFAGGTHALVVVLVGIQDAALRTWTGLAPGDVIARMGAADGPALLGVFTQLVGAHLATWLTPQVSLDTAREVFDAGVAIVTALALGLSPLRALRARRASRAEFSSRAWSIGARESE
jgi:hypothetical protein